MLVVLNNTEFPIQEGVAFVKSLRAITFLSTAMRIFDSDFPTLLSRLNLFL